MNHRIQDHEIEGPIHEGNQSARIFIRTYPVCIDNQIVNLTLLKTKFKLEKNDKSLNSKIGRN